jgi:hypothetical protein
MGLPRDASAQDIKFTYREIAKKFHPDKNPEQEGAEEYFKIITKGYNILSNPNEKRKYDSMMQGVDHLKKKKEDTYPKGDNRNPEDIIIKIRKIREYKKQEFIQQFIKREEALTHKIRYPFYIMLTIFGYFFVFNRWFVNEASMDYLYILLGFSMYTFSTVFLANHLFIHIRAQNLLGKWLSFHYEKSALTLFLILFFGGPLSIVGFNTIKKSYHLAYHSEYLTPTSVRFADNKAVFVYQAGGEIIHKSTSSFSREEFDYLQQNHQALVRLSKYNPKIAQLEFVLK